MDINSSYSMSKEEAKLAAAEESLKQIRKALDKEKEHRDALRELLNDTEQRIEGLYKDIQKAKTKIVKLRNKVEQEEAARKLQEQKSLEEKVSTDVKPGATSEAIPAVQPKKNFLDYLWASRESSNQKTASIVKPSNNKGDALPYTIDKEQLLHMGEDNNTEEYQEIWNKVLEIIRSEKKMSLYSCAKAGRLGIVDDTLVVTYKSTFQSHRMNKPDFRQIFEERLFQVTDKHLKLLCLNEPEYRKILASHDSEHKLAWTCNESR